MKDARRRYLDTMLFGTPDRVPLSPGHPRESTLEAWHAQGLPEGAPALETALGELGIPAEAALRFHGLGVSFRMNPEFEPVILDHRDGHWVVRDWMGAVTEIADCYDESYLRTARDFVTRKWHRFPVETREDWQEMKKRFRAAEPGRLDACLEAENERGLAAGSVPCIVFNGVFWQLREWCGFENLCVFMAEDPSFVEDMASFWSCFVSSVLDRLLARACPARAVISEDMAYKAHSMVSPAMVREFILPAYRAWVPKLNAAGCAVVELDSDGFVEELIPLWVEAGIHCCSPMEVAANNDIVRCRHLYGKDMAYMQGIDKRLIARGGSALMEHAAFVVPALLKGGGFIPGCDHGVPPDISWRNYLAFARMLAEYSGWL